VNETNSAAGRFGLIVFAGVMTLMGGFAVMSGQTWGGIVGITLAVVSA
jgi:hypothetical protein